MYKSCIELLRFTGINIVMRTGFDHLSDYCVLFQHYTSYMYTYVFVNNSISFLVGIPLSHNLKIFNKLVIGLIKTSLQQ